MSAADLIVYGAVAHCVADWLLQNEWQAVHKVSLTHPAAWVHGGIHTLALAFVFPFPVAICLGVVHMLIDTRKPRQWWSNLIRQTREGPMGLHVAIWVDQVMHLACVVLAALWATH